MPAPTQPCCPCINIINLHTDSSAGRNEGQTGTVSPWLVWQVDVTVAALVVTVTVVCYCPCINIINLHTDSSAGSVVRQTGIVSTWSLLCLQQSLY